MHRAVPILLAVAGIIHLLPLAGIFGAAHLARLYGVTIDDPNMLLLMRHRAVMFGLLGMLLMAAVFRPELRALAFAAGLINASAFVLLAWNWTVFNGDIHRVAFADLVAIACLVLALGLDWRRYG